MTGKEKCTLLRDIRVRVAQENNIPYTPHECGYKGECRGTCPCCEAEVRYLEERLPRRRSIVKNAVAGALAAGLLATAAGCGQNPQDEPLEGVATPWSEQEVQEHVADSSGPQGEPLEGAVAATERSEQEQAADSADPQGEPLEGKVLPDQSDEPASPATP